MPIDLPQARVDIPKGRSPRETQWQDEGAGTAHADVRRAEAAAEGKGGYLRDLVARIPNTGWAYGLLLLLLSVALFRFHSLTRDNPLLRSSTAHSHLVFGRTTSKRLPGLASNKGRGLGDIITRATMTLGIRHCSRCKRRAAALNRWVVFGRHPR